MRRKLEYAAAWPFIKILGVMPRPLSRAFAIGLAQVVYLLHVRLRQVGMRNLAMVFPEKSVAERVRILRAVFTSLGRQLAELCRFPTYTPQNVDEVVMYDGLGNYERAYAQGRGVLFLTAHFGGWELSAFAHSLHGHWLHIVMRPMDNEYLDQLLQHYRTMHGNKERGLALLRESAAHGVVTAVESRTVLSLFLRHDARYHEALVVQHGLATQYPHDYLYRLEEANLTKDEGNGPGAIALYRAVLADAARPGYFIDPRLQLALFGMADTQRGQHDVAGAAESYLEAAEQPNCSDWLRKRAQLNAGEMFDVLHQRAKSVKLYQMASAGGGDQSQAEMARRLLVTPYSGR